jgi:hypothetical protein
MRNRNADGRGSVSPPIIMPRFYAPPKRAVRPRVADYAPRQRLHAFSFSISAICGGGRANFALMYEVYGDWPK